MGFDCINAVQSKGRLLVVFGDLNSNQIEGEKESASQDLSRRDIRKFPRYRSQLTQDDLSVQLDAPVCSETLENSISADFGVF